MSRIINNIFIVLVTFWIPLKSSRKIIKRLLKNVYVKHTCAYEDVKQDIKYEKKNIATYLYEIFIGRFTFRKRYAKWLREIKTDTTKFVPLTSHPYVRSPEDVKIFAYYLPQFYAIPENDDAHGKGFTEWRNVASAMPQYIGHYQPKIPYDVGFYNLRDVSVMKRQAELAKMYGVYGFCFYYYWFSGKQVLELPLNNFLNSDIDLPFHFCWANENWSKLWDGGNKEVILEQKLQDGDAERFFHDILPFIKDSRYEKIDNKPILMIYNPTLFDVDRLQKFMTDLNSLAIGQGFDGFYYTASNYKGFNKINEYGFQAITEFTPHGAWEKCPDVMVERLEPQNGFRVLDANRYVEEKKFLYDADYPVFKSCFPCWDNLSRKLYSNGGSFLLSDENYRLWLKGILQWTKEHNSPNRQYVYITAWNEWAEGAMLEPTLRYGYKYLEILKQCMESMKVRPTDEEV